jgi:hypothetical protein
MWSASGWFTQKAQGIRIFHDAGKIKSLNLRILGLAALKMSLDCQSCKA